MNKIKFTATLVSVILGFVCLLPSLLSASDATTTFDKASLVNDVQLETRVHNMNSMIELRYNRKIGNYIRSYVNNYGQSTDKLLGRVTNYFPIFEAELRNRDLPQELKMLAVIESSLRPTVRSKVGAVGLWQFMYNTGKQYGLTINNSVDERRDPFRSTEAAFDFLEDLYERFDDWTLAVAAYNCGPGRVAKAIRLSGKKNYWELQSYLPKETQNYVPKLIAAIYLMNYYYLHDITPLQPSVDLKTASLTKIYERTSFDELSNVTGVSMGSLKDMNPAYIRNYIPESNSGFNLVLPEHSMYLFLENSSKVSEVTGESIGFGEFRSLFVSIHEIAESTGWVIRQDVEEIAQLDKMDYTKEELSNTSKVDKINVPPMEAYRDENEKYETYRLGKGESILDIVSRRKDLNLKEVLVLNNISLSRPPSPGTTIKLRKI